MLSSENNHTSFNNIQIFPNPVNKIINITGLTVPAFVEVYDINGKLLISTIQEWQDSTINVEHLVNGFYIIKIHNSKNYSAYKIFKM
ncbi:MAG: T9SS type A sorting domain-containing protein [Saprospiraceae bacterium]|nr:T9SS type A sorting domain-containing protein [Candidatus Brachybacter algidus]